MGMVFQGSALFDSMTVEENIMFPMQMLTRKSFEEMEVRANQVINRVNLVNANKNYTLKFQVACKKGWL